MERADEFEDLIRIENPQQDEYGNHQQPRRMSISFSKQAHERPPSSPNVAPSKVHRSSTLKYHNAIFPSASASSLVPVVHQDVRRRQSSTLSTVSPLTELRGQSPHLKLRHHKPSQNGHSKYTEHTLSREVSCDDEYGIDLGDFDDQDDGGLNDSKSSLGGYGTDLTYSWVVPIVQRSCSFCGRIDKRW